MAGEWEETTLGAEVDLLTGFPFKSERYTDDADSIRLVRGDNIVQGAMRWDGVKKWPASECAEHELFQLREGDVVLAMDRPWIEAGLKYAAISKYDLPCLLVQRTARLRGSPKLDTEFLRYLIGSREFTQHIHAITTGTAVPHISGRQIKDFVFALPPLAEQKAIAGVLGALDDKIELNRRMNATLEAMARALFQSWFVDFDPVRAKLDGRQPAGFDPATAALFPGHFAHGEHGILPVGWRHAAIEEVCAVNGWTLGKNDDLETLEYVEISEVSRGNIGNIATYPRGEEPSRARRRLRHGDTVLSTVRPDRGSYFLALNPPDNRVASTGFAVLTPTKVPWSFLHAALTMPEVSDHLGQMADGGAYPAVRPEIIGAMHVALPNEPKILEAFHRTCAPLFEHAETNRTQSRTLGTLRDTLLPKLLSGELSLPDLESKLQFIA
jgi:type I restriction enzyme S subunit